MIGKLALSTKGNGIMTCITRENAPALQSLFRSANMEKPNEGCIVKVLSGKHVGKIGIVKKHMHSRYENPYRYGNEMSHHMLDARGRSGYEVLIQNDNESFWVKANNTMVCCIKEWA